MIQEPIGIETAYPDRLQTCFPFVNEADYGDDLLVHNVDTKGEMEEHPKALELGVRAVKEPGDGWLLTFF